MASPHQQEALQRKLIYIVSIVVLLTASWAVRVFVVETKAQELRLREQDVGEVEVSGSALQLSLTGSRGFVVCALWTWAIEAQKKNRWNELDLYVRSLTKLQPHFISPWLFQSWNLAYNVSVEADQVKDKYFYVARGTELLAQGERKNRHHPELRYSIGFYQQHKICQSDETNVFRCLYQMSVIPPLERERTRFYPLDERGRESFSIGEFERFCKEHPQLVRRLHDKLRHTKPEDVVAFLHDNARIPSLYTDDRDELAAAFSSGTQAPLKALADRFPVLPPERKVPAPQVAYELPGGLEEVSDQKLDRIANDEFDAYLASRAWYGYAQEPLPGTDPDRPGKAAAIVNPLVQRMPRMTVALFRNYPPRAQSYIGERLAAEGWFDESGWETPAWFPEGPGQPARPRRLGTDKAWGNEAWGLAYALWEKLGTDTGLYMPPAEEAACREEAKRFWEKNGLALGAEPPERRDLKPGDADFRGFQCATRMHWWDYYRTLTNFPHHFYRAEVESKPETVKGRKAFFEADRLRVTGNREQAIARFEAPDALEAWRKLFIRFKNLRTDDFLQDDAYDLQMKYVMLLEDRYGSEYRQLLGLGRTFALTAQSAGPGWMGPLVTFAQTEIPAPPGTRVFDLTPEEKRRLDGTFKENPNDSNEQPQSLVRPDIRERVLTRLGRFKPREPTDEEKAQMMAQMNQGARGMAMPGQPAPIVPPPPKP